MAGDNGILQGIVPDYTTQVMPDQGQVYVMQNGVLAPSVSDYAQAMDPANKDFTSVNDSTFTSAPLPKVANNANVSIAEPIQVQNTVVRDVPTFDFKKALLLGAAGFIAYKLYKKGRAS